ncbi:MAG TPA: biotin--[acetyl-CoA-carboxylase] ligase [Thermoanaerobaculia bacterium]|nr:biotin--[acetyl-CoA-carboxylase] ligase [Thermoanaerobaculia bacterium]
MTTTDLTQLASRLRVIESIALVPRVSSTNEVARRVIAECFENDIPIPSAIIVAREQLAGRGRNSRRWFSPRDRGIYATILRSMNIADLAILPLAIANMLAHFLRETFRIDAKIKWPNDIVVDGKKIAGVLIEAKTREDEACVAIGIGINLADLGGDAPENVTSIEETSPVEHVELEHATWAFIEFADRTLAAGANRQTILSEWRRLTVHQPGDRIHCIIGDRSISGTWGGIDELGRALIRHGSETVPVSSGDLIS